MSLGRELPAEDRSAELEDREGAGNHDQRQDRQSDEETASAHWLRRLGEGLPAGNRRRPIRGQ
jgi:hypothetical protein